MGTVLGIIILIIVLPYFASRISQARNSAWSGPRTTAMRTRAAAPSASRGALGPASRKAARSTGTAVIHPRSGHIRAQARADLEHMAAEAGLANWLEERREEREERKERRAEEREVRSEERARQSRSRRPADPPPAPAGTPAPPAPRPAGATPAPAPSGSTGSTGSNGGNPVAAGTSTAGSEQVIEGIDRLVATAMAGNIITKREIFLALHEVFTRAGIGVISLSRDMAEPGSNYGPEITEPVARAGTQAQAAAMGLADADAALVALLTRSVAEMATSSQQTPHHRNELSESGAR